MARGRSYTIKILEGASASTPITGISFSEASHNRFDNNGDLYPVTWHSDGRVYTLGGDGDGWDGVDTRGLDVNRLDEVGPDGDLSQGSELDSKVDVLAHGIISIDGVMYRFEQERQDSDGDGNSWRDLMIGRSTDDGATWDYLGPGGGDPTVETDWAYEIDDYNVLKPVQMDQDYQTWWDANHGGEGAYVYMISNGGGGNLTDVFLVRCPRDQDLRDPANHEHFTGTDGENNAQWSSNVADRMPMFVSTDLHWDAFLQWNPVLNRFLLTAFDESNTGQLRVWEAETPWGPFTNIFDNPLPGALGDGIEKYGMAFQSKRGVAGVTDWLSEDGKTWWGVLSGMDVWDSFNTIEATLTT